jgi:hypothetical protein
MPNPASLVSYDRVVFLIVLGAAFVCFGLYNFRAHGAQGQNLFFIAMGVAFFIFGISQFRMTKKFRKGFQDKKG